MLAECPCCVVLMSYLYVLIKNNDDFTGFCSKSFLKTFGKNIGAHIKPILVQCWFIVCDAGPALTQQWMNV